MARGAKDENKERIIQAAEELFAEKGFDATRVNEIAGRAGVNKALIYYYFENKEAMLDHLIETVTGDIADSMLDFARSHIVQMIREKRLDILPDRFHFSDSEDLARFVRSVKLYYARLVDYILERRRAFRILVLESLKDGRHRFNLFGFMDLLKADKAGSVYAAIKEEDTDFEPDDDMIEFSFFFSLIPIVSFAVYFDNWRSHRGVDEAAARKYFSEALERFLMMSVSGQDIMIYQSTWL